MNNFHCKNNFNPYRTYKSTVLCIIHMSGERYKFYLTSPDFNPVILAHNFSGMIQQIVGQGTLNSVTGKDYSISLIITPSFEQVTGYTRLRLISVSVSISV